MSISPLLMDLLKAWMIGLIIAAPVGPVGMLCIRKTLERGLLGAIAVGLGAAFADGLYGLIAVMGLELIFNFLLAKAAIIKILGGIFLLYLAYIEINSAPDLHLEDSDNTKKVGQLISKVFFLTLANPMTIFAFVGIFASIGGASETLIGKVVMVLGIFLGSMSWWLMLGSFIVKIKHKLPESSFDNIRYVSGCILGTFGLIAIGATALGF